MSGEHYARTDSGELIGPYDTVEERDRELAEANRERYDEEAASEAAYFDRVSRRDEIMGFYDGIDPIDPPEDPYYDEY